MKNFSVFFLVLVLLFAGCSAEEIPSPSISKIIPEESSKSSLPAVESSGYENPYTSCVPEWSYEPPETDPSYVHSTEFSASEEPFEIFKINGRTTEIYPDEEENLNFVLGTEKELERWKSAINNLSEVSEIVICYIETEERKLDFYEVTDVINCLQTVSPEIKPEMDNPATGGSFTVFAYDSEGNPLWCVSPDYWFVLRFGNEDTVYILDSEDDDVSSIKGILDYRRSMNQP